MPQLPPVPGRRAWPACWPGLADLE